MEQVLSFFHNHTLLISSFVFILVALIGLEVRIRQSAPHNVTPQQATQLINRKNAVIIDIRTTERFAAGHLAGSDNVEKERIDENDKKLSKWKKNPLIVVCDSGQQSVLCCKKLLALGLEEVYCLQGGINRWIDEKLPLVKS